MIRTTVGTLRKAISGILNETLDIRQKSPDSPWGQMYGSIEDEDGITGNQYRGRWPAKADWDDQIDDVVMKIADKIGDSLLTMDKTALYAIGLRAAKWAGFDEEDEVIAAEEISNLLSSRKDHQLWKNQQRSDYPGYDETSEWPTEEQHNATSDWSKY